MTPGHMISASDNLVSPLIDLSANWRSLTHSERLAKLERLSENVESGRYHLAQRAACALPSITRAEAETEIAFFVEMIKRSVRELHRQSFQAEHEFESWDETWETLFAIQCPEAKRLTGRVAR